MKSGMKQVVIKVIGNYSYQTSKCLGEGVYGKVYEGMERETKQKVAIKKIDLETFTNDKYLENAIFSEIYLLKRFNHPNIVKFKDVLSSKNSLYIITEFCKNGDLKQLMKRRKFKEDEVFEIMKQILLGFSELIRQKIVHRDLKPANILIHDGVYKIGDFGFAKYVDNFGSQMLKSCVGSPIYMAPQILERSQYTTKCDIWSLGIIFYEMIFGMPPWKARDQNQLLRGIKTISIVHVLKRSSLSPKANEFLKRTLAYSEEQRIGWGQLFDLFAQKPTDLVYSDRVFPKEKARGSLDNLNIYNNPSNGLITMQSQPIIPQLTSHVTQISPQPSQIQPQSLSPTNFKMPQNGGNRIDPNSQKRVYASQQQQVENLWIWRQFCIYYHFYCVELFVNCNYVRNSVGAMEQFGRFLYTLGLLVKSKSTYCISLASMHTKSGKQLDDIYRKMKGEHETYELIYNDIVARLEREGICKRVREQVTSLIGFSDIINEERNQKLENLMIKYAQEIAQFLSDEVHRRAKNLKELTIVEILQGVVDVLSLGVGKLKTLKEMKEEVKNGDEQLKDYVGKVISKLEKLTTSM